MQHSLDNTAWGSRQPFRRPFSLRLHGLRGAAALSVFAAHFLDFLGHDSVVLRPLQLIDGGVPAVALFFVLSGTVLGISLKDFRPELRIYAAYIIKRGFRLIPMMVISCSVGFLFSYTLRGEPSDGILGEEFYNFYKSPLTIYKLILSYAGLYSGANPPMWSIYVEIVASVLLPLFVLCSKRLAGSIILCISLTLLSIAASGADGHLARNHWPVYMVNFSTGLLLCHVGILVSRQINLIPRWLFRIIVLCLYLALMNGRVIIGLGQVDAHGDAASNLVDLAISAILVIFLMERKGEPAAAIFCKLVGDISYPLYLLHWPTLCLLLAGSVRILGIAWISAHLEWWSVTMLLMSGAIVFGLAWASFRWVEKPAIAAGKILADRLTRQSTRNLPPSHADVAGTSRPATGD